MVGFRIQQRVQRLFDRRPNHFIQMRLNASFIDLYYRTQVPLDPVFRPSSRFHGWLHRARLRGLAPPACTNLHASNSNQMCERNPTLSEWRERPLVGEFPYVFLDGLWLKRSWGGEVKNVSVLVAIGVGQSGYREILGVSEGAKEDKASWTNFLRELKQRGLKGVQLFVSDKCLGLVENFAEFYPEASVRGGAKIDHATPLTRRNVVYFCAAAYTNRSRLLRRF